MPSNSGSSRRHSRHRNFSRETNLERRTGVRQERLTILILTNGIRTEVDYFEAVKKEPWIKAGKVTVKFQAGTPADVVKRAAEIRDDNAYSQAWAVCDLDDFDVTEAIAVASGKEIEFALSVPCFEVWLILHLAEGCPGFNTATQAGTHLKKLVRTWDKTKLNYKEFQSGVFHAVTRASRLGDPPDANPSTAVWRLIESLKGEKISSENSLALRPASMRCTDPCHALGRLGYSSASTSHPSSSGGGRPAARHRRYTGAAY